MFTPRAHLFSKRNSGFTFPDFLAVLAVLSVATAIVLPIWSNTRRRDRQAQCGANLQQVSHALLSYAEDNGGKFLENDSATKGPGLEKALWWWYKEPVKGYLGLRNPSSPADKVFACPSDRGYEDGKPFRLSAKFDYGSYVYNGFNLPGFPNIAGRAVNSIRDPGRTLLVMEWTAHAPLSWHNSRTGRKNRPFYNDAESMVAFVDGRVDFIPIYYDGVNAAYTRDPIPGYAYKYSGD